MIEKIIKIIDREVKNYQVPVVDLIKVQTNDPFKVLISTILSARTKDQVTAEVSKRLYKNVRCFNDFRKLTQKQIEKLIFPVGFYKQKAGYLKKMPEAIDVFGGKIPETIEELVTLPGVGRKTANLVVAVAFEKPAICVDVHVHRIMNRIGYVDTKTPLDTEMELRRKLPKKYWIIINKILVAFGQNKCTPVSPHCSSCPIFKMCKRNGVDKSR